MSVERYIAPQGLAQSIALGNVCGRTMGRIKGRTLTTRFGGLIARVTLRGMFGEMGNALELNKQDGLWSSISADHYLKGKFPITKMALRLTTG